MKDLTPISMTPISSSSSTVNAMLLTGGTDETFARMTGSAVTTLLGDALGSTIQETNSSQTNTATLSYQPYGATTGTGSSMQQYTGRENDGTGLYYYRARTTVQAQLALSPRTPLDGPVGRRIIMPMSGGIRFRLWIQQVYIREIMGKIPCQRT